MENLSASQKEAMYGQKYNLNINNPPHDYLNNYKIYKPK